MTQPHSQAPAASGAEGPSGSLPPASEPQSGRGFAIAYPYLNRRERTQSEVRERLRKGAVGEPEITEVLEELQHLGLIDDLRYARVFIEDKRNLENWGNERIVRGLRERGIDRELIASALASAPEHDEHRQAVELLQRRFPDGLDEPRERDRAFGMLARKGYDSDLAGDAIRSWRGRWPDAR